MNGLLLAFLTILIPFAGTFLSLFLSQLEDYIAAEGKTRDWALFILVFLPTVIVSILLLPSLHDSVSSYHLWLPNLYLGIRISELSIAFAIIIASCSALLALYSIFYMTEDRNRTRYWFFLQLALAGMMLAIFANNLYWMFGGFEIVSLSAFFLISHFHQKRSEEGEKTSKAGVRYFIISMIGDVFLIIAISFIVRAFGSPVFIDIFDDWVRSPRNIIGSSSSDTRLLIEIFLVLGALIKSGQFPLLLWSLNGNGKDIDIAKAPLPIGAFLITVTLGNSGLFILSNFYPLFTLTGFEKYSSIELFSNVPFLLIGWTVICTMIIATLLLFTSDNLNRIMASASTIQMGFAFLGLSSANQLGFVGSIFHLYSFIPSAIALCVIFGMMYESLKRTTVSRISGLRENNKALEVMGLMALLTFVGIFPTSIYFSRDMIFKSLIESIIPSSLALLIISIICLALLVFTLSKNLMKTLYGELDNDIQINLPNIFSFGIEGLTLLWGCIAGVILLFIGWPTPRFVRGLLNTEIQLGYDFPIFSNWIISIIVLLLIPIIFTLTYFAYRDGTGKIFHKIRESKFMRILSSAIENMFYLEAIYLYGFTKSAKYISKFITNTRLKSSALIVIFAVFALIALFVILFILGGTN